MFDPERWVALKEGRDCPACRANDHPEAEEGLLVAQLDSGRVVLQNDADFPGYCILYFRRHATELFELTAEERATLMEDVTRIARAVQEVQSPAKINYAILGNETPHLHSHVIPRYPEDGYWGKPIWSRPADQKRTLSPADHESLRARLRAALTV